MSQHWKINIAAQVAQDAAGKPYPEYQIPEPKSYQTYRDDLEKLKTVPRSEIGSNPDIQPPRKYGVITLKRGGEPIELEVCDELLNLLKSDRKNLLIFGVEKVGGTPTKQAQAR